MKTTLIMIPIFVSSLLFGAGSVAFPAQNPPEKLKRGIVNVLTAPIEVPREVRAHWIKGSEKTTHILVWLFSGTVKGIADTAKRFGSGLWDIGTFPFAVPKDYEPLLKPDYVFDEWPRREIGVIYKNIF